MIFWNCGFQVECNPLLLWSQGYGNVIKLNEDSRVMVIDVCIEVVVLVAGSVTLHRHVRDVCCAVISIASHSAHCGSTLYSARRVASRRCGKRRQAIRIQWWLADVCDNKGIDRQSGLTPGSTDRLSAMSASGSWQALSGRRPVAQCQGLRTRAQTIIALFLQKLFQSNHPFLTGKPGRSRFAKAILQPFKNFTILGTSNQNYFLLISTLGKIFG